MAVAALVLYLRAARDHTRGRRIGMVIYVVLVGALAFVGQLGATEPAPRTALIVNWIVFPVVFAAIAWSIDRSKAATPQHRRSTG